jgi:hypothetical protein
MNSKSKIIERYNEYSRMKFCYFEKFWKREFHQELWKIKFKRWKLQTGLMKSVYERYNVDKISGQINDITSIHVCLRSI